MVCAALQVAKIHIKKNLLTARTQSAFVMMLIVLDYHLSGIRNMCADTGNGVSLWGMVVLVFSDAGCRCLLIMLFAFLTCDLPGRDQAEPYVYQRCGVSAWITGKMLASIAWACIFIVTVILGCAAVLNRFISLDLDWGKVLRTLAKSDMAGEYQVQLYASSKIIGVYSVGSAMAYTVLLNLMTCAMLGLMILALNAWCGKAMGNVIAVGMALLSREVGGMILSMAFLKFSPCSWGSLEVIGDGRIDFRPTLVFSITAMSAGILIPVLAMYITRKKISVYSK